MSVLINPGSENKGGTQEESLVIAHEWLDGIHEEGFLEVVLLPGVEMCHGLWRYTFRHSVTEKTATLDTHGFTEEECDRFMFRPRMYWNGSSICNLSVEDWMPDGWGYRIEFYAKKTETEAET